MGFPTKIQIIKRAASEQWYINFPSALAQAMDFSKGEIVEWSISDKAHLILTRTDPPADAVLIQKKTPLPASKIASKPS